MLNKLSIIVRAFFDEEAGVWVASSNDIHGLAVEADSLEALGDKVASAVSDLIELNGAYSDIAEIPVQILAETIVRVPNPRF